MKSKIISLSAVSAGLTAIFLIIGAYIELFDLFTVIIASVFVILPLYYRSYKGSLLCALAGGVVAFLCSGFNILSLVFPAYFAFFAFYPIAKFYMMEKQINKYICLIIGLIWLVAVAYGCYFYLVFIIGGAFDGLPLWIIDYVVYIVAGVAVIFYFIYDRFLLVARFMADKYLRRIIK